MTSLQYQEFLRKQGEEDERLLDLYVQLGNVHDVVSVLIDEDVSRGEYEGCSSELEIAYSEHAARVERVLREGGRMTDQEKARLYLEALRCLYRIHPTSMAKRR